MTKPVRFDAEAEAELEAAAARYESHRLGFGAKLGSMPRLILTSRVRPG